MPSPALLWIDAIWIAVLAFLALVVQRELSVLQALVRANGGGAVADGPEIGSAVPRRARTGDDRLFVFLFGDCPPCHEVADRLHRLPGHCDLTIVVTDGGLLGSSASVLPLIPTRPRLTLLTGRTGEQHRAALRVHSGPFAVMTRGGVVTAKGYLRGETDILRLASITTGLELAHAHRDPGAS